MSTGILMGNTASLNLIKFTFDAASVAANTTAEQDVTVAGLKVGDIVLLNKPALNAGLGIANARVKAADTLAITYVNATAEAINPGAEEYTMAVLRADGTGPRAGLSI